MADTLRLAEGSGKALWWAKGRLQVWLMGGCWLGGSCSWAPMRLVGVHIGPSLLGPKLKAGKPSVIKQVLAFGTDRYRGLRLFSWILLETMPDFPQV